MSTFADANQKFTLWQRHPNQDSMWIRSFTIQFRNGLEIRHQNYRNDGRYTIDNLEAERTVRPITRARKSSLHHSSEEGLQMALAYMTIIESAKRLGHECKDFLVRAWREAIYGNNDLEAMLQPVVVAK